MPRGPGFREPLQFFIISSTLDSTFRSSFARNLLQKSRECCFLHCHDLHYCEYTDRALLLKQRTISGGHALAEYSPILDELHEKCGVFGAYGVEGVANTGMRAMVALNHRGQEGAGLVTYDGADFYFAGNGGLVREILTADVLAGMHGTQAVGHTRYGTSGDSGGAHIQPIREGNIYFAENGNQCDVSPLTKFLDARGRSAEYHGRKVSDSELKAKVLGCLVMEGLSTDKAVESAFPLFTGAFASVIMDKDSLVAVRDRCGIRPLVLGRKGAGWLVASETCAIVAAGGEVVREVEPGEMIKINTDGLESRQLAEPDPKDDIFETIYFASEASEKYGQSNFTTRRNMGRQLALEHPVTADIVVPVPNSAIPAAIGYAEASGTPYIPAISKSSYIHRTFIGPTQAIREQDRAMKLSAVRDLVKGKRVAVLDDSIVRGNTQEGVVELLFQAGAKEVHVLITSPPIKYPDFYGINTPKQEELAYVKYGGVEGVRKKIRATSLGYLSLEGMVGATGLPASRFCLSAFTGEYPLDIGDLAKTLRRV